MVKEDGGPAFPTEPNTQPGFYKHHGMSLRDYFAAQALVALLGGNWQASVNEPRTVRLTAPHYADSAYCIADAMLAARTPSNPGQGEIGDA